MKKLFVFMGLFVIAGLLTGCSGAPSKSYMIAGELLVVEPEPPEVTENDTAGSNEMEDANDAAGEEVAEPEEPVVDWSTAIVAVSHNVEGEDGETIEEELASAPLVDGKFTISGEIETATEVKVTAKVGEEELVATALLTPGGKPISMVLVDDMNEYPADGLFVLGESRSSQDPDKKLVISGDFSEIDRDLNMATIGVYGRSYNDGSMQSFSLGYVMLNEGKFLIEADVSDAQIVTFYLSTQYSMEDYVFVNSRFVAEPKVSYDVELRGEDYLFVTSGEGKHAELIESWEQSTEYQDKFEAYETAYVAYMAEQDAMSETDAQTTDVSDTNDQDNSDADTETDSENAVETDADLELVAEESQDSTLEPAEGCEDVVIDQTHRSMAAMFFSNEPREGEPEYETLQRELGQMKNAAMREIVDNSDNPINVLLAMELGAISPNGEDSHLALPVYDRLAEQLNPEIVAQRVTPARDDLVVRIERNENDGTLLQGQKVPAFTLANADGVDMALYDILADNQVTLIDFWASWCGPCIATFPDLKRLYTAYSNQGFEIVGVSIDDNFDDWNEASIEHEIPWIDLGELKDWEGPVAVSYGVGFIPKAYLVDSNGCVLKKHVHPQMLEDALAQRFGELPAEDELDHGETEQSEDPGTDDMGG
ncbi:MAG: TlpA disulfide reductase family protein [Gammaproteobacteria bacterium]|nr:TlpA disulfide reductase family protein [Gammaproteobacteria bacterium]